MIDTKIDNLFKTIKESKEYQDYIKIENDIKKDKDLISLIEESNSLFSLLIFTFILIVL